MPSFIRPHLDATRLRHRSFKWGFTLPEVIITLAILLVIMVAVMEFVAGIGRAWKSGASDPFEEADEAFETVAKTMSEATLESYQDEADSSGAFRTNLTSTFVPNHPARRSDLDFVTGPSAGTNGLLTSSGRVTTGSGLFFLAPQGYTQTDAHTGMGHLLNAVGYFVEFGDDDTVPAFIPSGTHTWRWRLKQVMQPSESLQIFALTTTQAWIQPMVQPGASTSVLAENIITLIVLPERAANDSGTALSPTYGYDSRDAGNPLTRHQLPPRVHLALVAMDQASAQLLAGQYLANPPALVASGLFQQAAKFEADLTTLDNSLTAQKIGHRIFQRDILLPAAAWSNTPSQ